MFSDPNKDIAGSMYMGKTMVGSDEAIQMYLISDGNQVTNNSPDGLDLQFTYVGVTIKKGWYTLIKQ